MKNHIATELRLAAAATLGAALLSSTGMAQKPEVTDLKAEIARLDAALAPIVLAQDSGSQPAESVSLRTTSPEYLAALVQKLLASNIPDRVSLLGEAAAPELLRLANELDLVKLVDRQPNNPFVQLASHLPEAALQFLMDLQVSSPLKFEALLKEGWLPMKFARRLTPDHKLEDGQLKTSIAAYAAATVKNEQLPLDTRLHEAVQAYQLGIDSSACVSLIRAHPAKAREKRLTGGRRLHELLYPEGTPLPLDISPDLAEDVARSRRSRTVFMELAAMPSPQVRKVAVSVARDSLSEASAPEEFNGALDLAILLLGDEDPDVARDALFALLHAMRPNTKALEAEQLVRIAEGIHSRTWIQPTWAAGVPPKFLAALRSADDVPVQALERIFRAGLDAKDEALRQYWQSHRIKIEDVRQSLAYAGAALALNPESTVEALAPAKKAILESPRPSAEFAAAVLAFLRVGEPDSEEIKKRVKALTAWRGGLKPEAPKAHDLLGALKAEDRMSAIRFMTSRDVEVAVIAGSAVEEWTGIAAPLRALIADADEPRRIRLFAYLALIIRGECSSDELSDLSDWLVELAQGPEGRKDVLWALEVGAFSNGGDSVSYQRRAQITARLLADESVSDEIAVEARLPLRPSHDPADLAVVRQVLDAAEARQNRSSESLDFRNLSYNALRWMEAHGDLVRPKLLKGWIEHQHALPSAMAVAALSTFPELRKIAEDYYLDRIASMARGDRPWQSNKSKSTVDIIFRMPGKEPVARLLDYTLKSDNNDLTSYVEERITTKLRLTEAVARWSVLAAGGETIEGARAKVALMLDAKDDETRVQAIYALGTLGAIEAIPRILEFVSSDNEAEKAAALEALATLRNSAKRGE